MLEALVVGERSPKVLAQLARGTMRNKITLLEEALAVHFDDRHAFLLRTMLRHIDYLTTDIAEVTARIEVHLKPYRRQVAQLLAIPGVGSTGAQELIAEIGLDMSAFPSSDHLVSWPSSHPKPANQPARKRQLHDRQGQSLAGRHSR
jgi:transposase